MIEQALAAAGIDALIGNAPPAHQRGAKYWRAFIGELQLQASQLQAELRQTQREAAELRRHQPSPLELLAIRARQGSQPLEQCYRQLCLRLHPDQGGSAAAFRQLQADYEAVRESMLQEQPG